MQGEILGLVSWVVMLFPIFIIIFTVRGFFKALIAKLMGDDTPQREGFLTINPLAHINVIGLSILMVAILLLGALFGGHWPRGSLLLLLLVLGVGWTVEVPVDSRNFNYYRLGGILTSLAGSLSNFLLVLLVLSSYRVIPFDRIPGYGQKTIIEFIETLAYVALWFGVIDLIPLPPFDGGRALYFILPDSQHWVLDKLEDYALIVIACIFLVPGISDFCIGIISKGIVEIRLFLEFLVFGIF